MPKPGKTAAERRHHHRVAVMLCSACGRYGVEVHHVVSDGFKRLSKCHRRVVPLCANCHRTGPYAVHRVSHAVFCEMFHIDLLAEADALWDASEQEERKAA